MKTRCIGMQPDSSGHPLAPMEYVYVCEEPKRSFVERALDVGNRAFGIAIGAVTVAMVVFGFTVGPLEAFGVDTRALLASVFSL